MCFVIYRVSQIKHTEADGGRREGKEKKTACLSTLLAAGTALLLAEPLRPPATLAPVAGKTLTLAWLRDAMVVVVVVMVGGGTKRRRRIEIQRRVGGRLRGVQT